MISRRTLLLAAARRKSLLARMQEVMGAMPRWPKGSPKVEVAGEVRFPNYTRRAITFEAEPGDRVPAFVLAPRAAGRRPAMVCLHQTTRIGKAEPAGLGGSVNLHYAQELAERGYVAIVPDYPNYGDYRFDPYAAGYASATMKGIINHMRAIDVLAAMEEVDRDRIGAIGHSLGGHNTLFLAAFDRRVKAAVTSCGFTSFGRYMGGDLTGWSHKGYMPRIASEYGKDPGRMPFDFPELLASLAPRGLFINAPVEDANFDHAGVRECVAEAEKAYRAKGKADKLIASYPLAKHDFPPAVRKAAYASLEAWLKG